jgi:Dyp-type peroxidase family
VPAQPQLEANKEVVRRLVERVLVGRDVTAVRELVDDAGGWFSQQAFTLLADLGALPGYTIGVDDLIAEGDLVAARLTLRGTHSAPLGTLEPTGRQVEAPLVELFWVRDGRIVDGTQGWDRASFLEQLRPGPGVRDPLLAVDEIQGNVVPGFRKDYETLLFFAIEDLERARAWLDGLRREVATAAEVLQFNRLFSELRARRGREGTVESTWTNVALSHRAVRALAPDSEAFVDAAFAQDMLERSELLGDPVDPEADGHVGRWLVGGPHSLADVLVIVASDDRDDLAAESERLKSSAGGIRLVFEQEGSTLPYPLAGHEHFGYKDGISQPGVRGVVSAAPGDFLTPRRNPADPNQARPGEPLIWPGEFVFGYPRQDASDPLRPGPPADAGPEWAANGSLLVFRRYRQDVERFKAFVAQAAGRVAAADPAFAALTPHALGAKLFGRWGSGAPLVRSPDADNPALGGDDCASDNFAYAAAGSPIAAGAPGQCEDTTFPPSPGDPEAVRCPYAAHIRKTYPRDELGPEAETHRLLRRGIPFGAPAPAAGERGLLFLCYQTSIERQFEHVVRNWANNPNLRSPGEGIDPIIGEAGGAATSLTLRARAADGTLVSRALDLPSNWTTATGGGYFFVPSVRGLAYLVGPR